MGWGRDEMLVSFSALLFSVYAHKTVYAGVQVLGRNK